MNKLLASLIAIVASLVPSVAAAQTSAPAPLATPAPAYGVGYATPGLSVAPRPTTGPRVRFGIGGNVSGAVSFATGERMREPSVGSIGLGLSVDVGAQVDDRLALYAHGVVSTCILTSQASLHAVAEYTPVDLVSIGTGIGWQGVATLNTLESAGRALTRGGVSVPLILGLNFGPGADPTGRRRAFRLGLEAAMGFDGPRGDAITQASISFGYVAM